MTFHTPQEQRELATIEAAARQRFEPLAERHASMGVEFLEAIWATWLAAFAAGALWEMENEDRLTPHARTVDAVVGPYWWDVPMMHCACPRCGPARA